MKFKFDAQNKSYGSLPEVTYFKCNSRGRSTTTEPWITSYSHRDEDLDKDHVSSIGQCTGYLITSFMIYSPLVASRFIDFSIFLGLFQKISSLFPMMIFDIKLCFIYHKYSMSDGYLSHIHQMDIQSISTYLKSHLESYHETFISIPFLMRFGKHLLFIGAPHSKWFILLIYLITDEKRSDYKTQNPLS